MLSPPTATILLWAIVLVNSIAYLPQILKNHRRQSTSGLSKTWIFLLLGGISAGVAYIYLLNLPLPYKVVVPFQLALVSVMAGQAIMYEKDRNLQNHYGVTAFWIATCFASALLLGVMFPQAIGNFCGWTMVSLYTICRIPQIIKNYQRKSTESLSLRFMLLTFVGSSIELLGAYTLLMPTQAYVNAGRGLLFSAIFLGQFVTYRQ